MRITRAKILSTLVISLFLLVAACGSSGSAESNSTSIIPTSAPRLASSLDQQGETPTPIAIEPEIYRPGVLPEGWQRVQVRHGLLGRNVENHMAGFTIELPPGWTVVESLPGWSGAEGWIAAHPLKFGDYTPTLRFTIGGGFKYHLPGMLEDPRSDVHLITIDGKQAILHLAQPNAINSGPQVGIFFPEMPGGEETGRTPSLSIDSDSRGLLDQDELAHVLTSVRYEELSELPAIPAVEVVPADDWVFTPARTDWPSFEMRLPPGWEFVELVGIDSLVGRITNGDVVLFYDFGSWSGNPYDAGYRIRDGRPNPPHVQWEEEIDGVPLFLVRPVSGDADPDGVTGLFMNFNGIGGPLLSVYGSGLDGAQQHTVLAMLRTVRLESGYPAQSLPGASP